MNPKPLNSNPKPQTPNPQTQTPSSKLKTQDPKLGALSSKRSTPSYDVRGHRWESSGVSCKARYNLISPASKKKVETRPLDSETLMFKVSGRKSSQAIALGVLVFFIGFAASIAAGMGHPNHSNRFTVRCRFHFRFGFAWSHFLLVGI